ncbi:hypothetical protein HYQ45_007144 [Verticillium longisporum]|uniref:Uncharacterized protein n=1 Tax=Verticillium longisporum TaxID=100787 RepID=A0A8I2ZPQ9_VERLO|nr:hypothetical protein HYQ45_007144 [Verticillium longisporum]
MHYLFFDAPQDFVDALKRTFRTCFSERSQILSSSLLFKKPVVSTFQISELPFPAANLGLDHTIVLPQPTIDHILTETLITPSSIAAAPKRAIGKIVPPPK